MSEKISLDSSDYLHKMLYSKSFSKAEIFSPKFKCFVPARHEFEFLRKYCVLCQDLFFTTSRRLYM